MDKEDMVHTHTHTHTHTLEYYSAIKKNNILSFAAAWMDLESIMLSEIRQWQILYDLIYMWNLKKQQQQKTKLTEKEIRFVVTRGRGGGGGEIGWRGSKGTNFQL